MSPTDSGSEGESGEKPVRERLKHTTIDKPAEDEADDPTAAEPAGLLEAEDAEHDVADGGDHAPNGKPTSRVAKKRSFEDMGKAESTGATEDTSNTHIRKRTREGLPPREETEPKSEDGTSSSSEAASPAQEIDGGFTNPPTVNLLPKENTKPATNEHALQSPRKKRSRETMDAGEDGREQKIQSTEEAKARRSLSEERADAAKEEEDDASAAPKFGELLKPKPLEKKADLPQTSSTAFAASGFASLSSSATPFGSFGGGSPAALKSTLSPPSSASPFKSPDKSPATFGSSFAAPASGFGSNGSTSGFGANGSTSAFGSQGGTSGFGGALGGSAFGRAFGGGFGSGSKLSSFASPVGDANLETKSAEKPFGASKDEEENSSELTSDTGDDPEGEADASTPKEEEETPTKFKPQDVHTGEDDEDTVFVNRGKLFQFHNDQKAWKERGVGPFKVNMHRPDDSAPKEEVNGDVEEQKPKSEGETNSSFKGRFIMRNHATHKVILNTPIFKEMSVKEQSGKQLLFICPNENGEMTTYTLRMSKEEDIKHLLELVQDLQRKM